jgi:hypothetical protein
MGFRTEGGFVGVYDRSSGEPIPDHLSANWQDLDTLIQGLLDSETLMENSEFHPVLCAAKTAFLFDCVNITIETIIPQEVSCLRKYNDFKMWLDDTFEMPDKMVALLVRLLEQNSQIAYNLLFDCF